MKILIFSKHFWPDNFKINIIATELVNRGHKVTVLTSNSSYHISKNKKYKTSFFLNKKKWNGIDIYYLPVFKKKQYKSINIILDYFSHFLSLFFYCHFFIKKKFDLIFVFGTSPIFQSIPAIYFSYLVKKPLILWVQDLWPDSLIDTGYIKNRFFLNIIKFFVKMIYNFSTLILVQSNNFRTKIKKDFNLKKKILTYYNLTELRFQKFLNSNNKKFTIVYSGNFGEAQDFETLLNVIKIKEVQKLFYFKLIGSGKKFDYIKKHIIKNNLSQSVKIEKYMTEKKLYRVLSKSDALFITLKRGLALDNTIPGKFQTYLAFGKPLLANCVGATKKIIIDTKIGYSNSPGDANTLYKNLINVKNLSAQKKINIYKRSKLLYDKYFAIDTNLNYLESILDKIKN
ncbi:glycosyltransferase family 4 protein [Candidatus Pelagibacter sp.]|jgi:glycosyltransferase involved in cell wall biosynthesis|nr:glycosyltransferase family 4 protein [Candidatus Pelagibacter sp.]